MIQLTKLAHHASSAPWLNLTPADCALNSVFTKLIIFWRVGLKFAVSISGKTASPGDLSRRTELMRDDNLSAIFGWVMTTIGTISNSAITLKIIQRFFEKNLGAPAGVSCNNYIAKSCLTVKNVIEANVMFKQWIRCEAYLSKYQAKIINRVS